jgi:hypothetical protein
MPMVVNATAREERAPGVLLAVALALVVTLTSGISAIAQSADRVDAAVLEAACAANARDEATLEDCLAIVRTVLAPGGHLLLPNAVSPSVPPSRDVGMTQTAGTLAVTLLGVEWDAALFPRDEADVVAVELAFESLVPEAYVDPAGITAIDEGGFSHPWGAIHRMGDAPQGGYLDQGRRQRGWVGFDVPAGTQRVEIEYRDTSGERAVWNVERSGAGS